MYDLFDYLTCNLRISKKSSTFALDFVPEALHPGSFPGCFFSPKTNTPYIYYYIIDANDSTTMGTVSDHPG